MNRAGGLSTIHNLQILYLHNFQTSVCSAPETDVLSGRGQPVVGAKKVLWLALYGISDPLIHFPASLKEDAYVLL